MHAEHKPYTYVCTKGEHHWAIKLLLYVPTREGAQSCQQLQTFCRQSRVFQTQRPQVSIPMPQGLLEATHSLKHLTLQDQTRDSLCQHCTAQGSTASGSHCC
jgi:hypothetical protein